MHAENIDWVKMDKGRVAFFLHYNEKSLFVDFFVRDIPILQRFIGIEVYKDSCMELVFGYHDDSKYLDISMALTQCGPELFVRRGLPDVPTGLVRQAKLLILDSPEDNVSCYRYRFDLVEDGMPDLFKPGMFKLTLVVKGVNQSRIVPYSRSLAV